MPPGGPGTSAAALGLSRKGKAGESGFPGSPTMRGRPGKGAQARLFPFGGRAARGRSRRRNEAPPCLRVRDWSGGS